MRRADRLFQIVQLLRQRRLTTAARLAERLEVSERTIYRDVQDLVRSGVPVQGEAGVGYRLGANFELPPLMFNVDEVQAMVLGARMVQAWGDEALRLAAGSALDKIEAVLPAGERHRVHDTALFSVGMCVPDSLREAVGRLRGAIDSRAVVEIAYRDHVGASTQRAVRPLGLYFWGATWTLGAWCELREDFRNFRLDRIERADVTDREFALEPPVTLEAFRDAMTRD